MLGFYREKKFEVNNIPISVLTLNKWNNNVDYEFNEAYKDPKGIINYLNSKNIILGLNISDPIIFNSKGKDIEKLNIPYNYKIR